MELRDEMETDIGIKDDMDLIMLLGNLGADTRSYTRESKRARNVLVSEIFSPPRVTKLLSSMLSSKLLPGFALDLTCIDVDDGLPFFSTSRRSGIRPGACSEPKSLSC